MATSISRFSFSSINQLNKIFECVACVMIDSNINLNGYGLSIRGMDSAHVSFIDLFIDKSEFKEWECFEEVIIGLNLKNLIRILSVGKEDDEVIFEYENGSDVLTIIINSPIRRNEYELKLFTIESDILEIPDMDYITTIKMNPSYYSQIINEISIVGSDSVEFVIKKDKINIISSGDIGKSTITLDNTSQTISDAESVLSEEIKSKLIPKKPKPTEKKFEIFSGDTEYKITFSLVLLNKMKKGLDLTNKLVLCLMDGVPLRIELEITEKSYIHYYLAPKIIDSKDETGEDNY